MKRYETTLASLKGLYDELYGFKAVANIFRPRHTYILWCNLGHAIDDYENLTKAIAHHEKRIKELTERLAEQRRSKTQFIVFNGSLHDPKVAEYLAKRSSNEPEIIT